LVIIHVTTFTNARSSNEEDLNVYGIVSSIGVKDTARVMTHHIGQPHGNLESDLGRSREGHGCPGLELVGIGCPQSTYVDNFLEI
jgi:hypothetical protein